MTNTQNKYRSNQQDKFMVQVMRQWLYTFDHTVLEKEGVDKWLKENVTFVRKVLNAIRISKDPDDVLIMIFLYADRFIEKLGYMDHAQLGNILIVSIIITVKFWDDKGIRNRDIAKLCRANARYITRLEQLFLTCLDYHLFLSPEEISDFYLDARRKWCERQALFPSPSLSSTDSSSSCCSSPSSPSLSSSESSPSSSPSDPSPISAEEPSSPFTPASNLETSPSPSSTPTYTTVISNETNEEKEKGKGKEKKKITRSVSWTRLTTFLKRMTHKTEVEAM